MCLSEHRADRLTSSEQKRLFGEDHLENMSCFKIVENPGFSSYLDGNVFGLICFVSGLVFTIVHVAEAGFYEWRKRGSRNVWLMMVTFPLSHGAHVTSHHAQVTLNGQILLVF